MNAKNSLCLDVGNSTIFAGVFDPAGTLLVTFRMTSGASASADEYGVFLKAALRENGLDPASVGRIAISSVVPDSLYSLRRSCQKYFSIEPFVLKAGVKTGLKITCRNPLEVGADRIANSVAAVRRYPARNIIIVDMGTATSFDVITSEREYPGNAIAPGFRIGMEALERCTARLPSVEIARPEHACGRTTVESIQSGLYHGHVGMIREMIAKMSAECFGSERPVVLGTGGFSHLLSEEQLFDEIIPDLVLEGILIAMTMNGSGSE